MEDYKPDETPEPERKEGLSKHLGTTDVERLAQTPEAAHLASCPDCQEQVVSCHKDFATIPHDQYPDFE